MFNDHFDKVFCLNLPIRDDRREKIYDVCSRKDVDFEFFSAVRGFAIPYVHSLVADRFSAAGYVGTLISYLNLFDYALNKGYNKICVIEDDVMVHKNIHSIADEYIPKLPENADMAYFSYIPLSDDHSMWNYNMINDRFVSGNVSGGIMRAKNLCSMMAFSINRKLMEHLMKVLNESFQPIDLYIMANIQGKEEFGVYAINPQMFCSTEGYSDGCGYTIENLTNRSVDLRASRYEDYE
jgi:GR25 family glycosyltransferase involved in LPS biosynthesis